MASVSRRSIGWTVGAGGVSPCVCNTLRMVTRAVTQLYDDVLRPSGVRVTQFSILATIGRMREANLKQLEDTLAIDQTTLTRSLNLLERDGLIERSPHPDGRVKAMRLASKGARVLETPRIGKAAVSRRAAAARPSASPRRREATIAAKTTAHAGEEHAEKSWPQDAEASHGRLRELELALLGAHRILSAR